MPVKPGIIISRQYMSNCLPLSKAEVNFKSAALMIYIRPKDVSWWIDRLYCHRRAQFAA